jgi:uncharacterized membrane protein YbhN (UPF0104 family)
MARKHLPWEEILLWSLLGGVLVYGLSWVGLAIYRWVWDEEALQVLTGDQMKLYSFGVVAVGALLTAGVLWFGARRETPNFERRDIERRRR